MFFIDELKDFKMYKKKFLYPKLSKSGRRVKNVKIYSQFIQNSSKKRNVFTRCMEGVSLEDTNVFV